MAISIRFGKPEDWPGFVAEKLFDGEWFPVCSPTLLKRYPALGSRRPFGFSRRAAPASGGTAGAPSTPGTPGSAPIASWPVRPSQATCRCCTRPSPAGGRARLDGLRGGTVAAWSARAAAWRFTPTRGRVPHPDPAQDERHRAVRRQGVARKRNDWLNGLHNGAVHCGKERVRPTLPMSGSGPPAQWPEVAQPRRLRKVDRQSSGTTGRCGLDARRRTLGCSCGTSRG